MFYAISAVPLWLNNNYNLRCQPNKIYRSEYGECMCTEEGAWPNKYCRSYFRQNEQECKPHEYILVDCNICRCDSNGKIDKRQCTKYVCKNKPRNFRRSSHNTCQPGMWYTLSPCRICYCADENKLLCNNISDTPKVRIGKHELNMCGESLLEDMQELMFNNAKNTDNNRLENAKTSKKGIIKNKKGKSKKGKHKKHQTENTNKDEEPDTRTKYNKNEYDVFGEKTASNNIKDESDIFIATDVRWDDGDDDDEEKESSKIKFPLPDVLSKFLNLVMRKSMVTIDSGTDCTPGSTTKVDCNTCFCLVNKKMICTKNVCN